MNYIYKDGELYHFGVKGMRWGVRRYQNKDGSLTEAGKRRVKEDGSFKSNKEMRKEIREERSRLDDKLDEKYGVSKAYEEADDKMRKRLGRDHFDWDDDDIDQAVFEKLYKNPISLENKKYSELDKTLRSKYGKDYDNFVKSEQTTAIVAGFTAVGVTLAVPFIAYQGLKAGSKGLVKLGEIAVKAMMKK